MVINCGRVQKLGNYTHYLNKMKKTIQRQRKTVQIDFDDILGKLLYNVRLVFLYIKSRIILIELIHKKYIIRDKKYTLF